LVVATAAAHTRKVAVTPARELRIGELRRHVRLGSEAVYRVCDWDQMGAEVEVVRAPGLRPGQRFQFTLAAVIEMTVVPDPADRDAAPAGS
jgi:hypothetical protein